MRRTFAAFAAVSALFAGGGAAHAEDVTGDDSVWKNTGETGIQTMTFNVTVPNERDNNDVLMKIAADCEYDTKGIPNTNDVIIYAAGHTTATPSSTRGVPGGTPISVDVTCWFTNSYGELTFGTGAPGLTNANAGQKRIRMNPFQMCIQVSVHYFNTDFVRTQKSCRDPISPI